MSTRIFLTSLFCITLSFSAISSNAAILRPEIGKPLLEAQKLAAAHDYQGAMALINKADAVANKSDTEKQTVENMRTYVAAKMAP
jgi:hypothetical protein